MDACVDRKNAQPAFKVVLGYIYERYQATHPPPDTYPLPITPPWTVYPLCFLLPCHLPPGHSTPRQFTLCTFYPLDIYLP